MAPTTVYHFDRQRGSLVAVAAEALVCDLCGASHTTDEPGRGLFVDQGADGQELIRCRCGAVYYQTDTPHLLSAATLRFIASYIAADRIATVADGVVVCRGWVPSGHALQVPAGYQEQTAWKDGGRRVWLAPAELAMLTWVEGDVMLDLYPSVATFNQAVEGAAAYYRQ